MTTLQEYDIEIKLDKIVLGRGLWKLVVEAKENKDDMGTVPKSPKQ